MQGTTHIFQLVMSEKGEEAPHLAAATVKASDKKEFRPVKLNAIGRARAATVLNGAIPGSAAASAAVNMYNGNQGRFPQPTA